MADPLSHQITSRLCETLGAEPAPALRMTTVALRLFAQTQHVHGLTKTARPLVELAAAIRGVGVPAADGEGFKESLGAALHQCMPALTPTERDIVVSAVAPQAGEGQEASGGATVPHEIARRIAALVGLAEGVTCAGRQDATVAAALDDGLAIELLVSGNGSVRETVAAARAKLAAWNSTMLRPIRAVVVYEGTGPPTSSLPPEPTAADVARHVLQTQWQTFRSRVYGLSYGEDIEYVHELRVALRRLRAALKVFRKALDGLVPALRGELKRLADALGKVRDSDVLLVFLREYAGRAPQEHWPYLRALLRAERQKRRRHFRALLALFASQEFAAFNARYGPVLAGRVVPGGLASVPRGADEPLARHTPRVLLKGLKAAKKLGRNLARASSEEQHALRIQCKRLRYTAEFFADLYRDGLNAIIGRMVPMQDALGEVHDADVYRERIIRYAARRRARADDPLAAQALGSLIGFLERWRAEALGDAAAAWKAFAKDKAPRKAAKAVG
ncbi:MAG TPA: CHAD domain-containing protein [Planctomycetota bacterium]|nr:CHAD domain-containing protein [Planctomycetota bacterium]